MSTVASDPRHADAGQAGVSGGNAASGSVPGLRLPHDKLARLVIKAHWLVLRDPTNLETRSSRSGSEAANQSLMTVYVIKEQLKMLRAAPTARTWRSAEPMDGSRPGKRHSRPDAVRQALATRLLARYPKPGALATHASQLEGVNKVIKRMAYGDESSSRPPANL